jgi:signal transduction histidine kinase
VSVTAESPLPAVAFDPLQFHQVFINLFRNALEAMPQGGELRITSRLRDGQAEITISDTGEGMPPEVVAKIFQPYFTTKEQGSGLGLAICQGIIQEHGGCLLAGSAPGRGASFTIQLPLEETAPAEVTPSPQS